MEEEGFVMKNYVSTSHVSSSLKNDYWQEIICDAYAELECVNIKNDNFYGSVELQNFADGKISKVIAEQQHVRRSYDKIRRSGHDHFLLSLQTSGQSIVRQHARDAFMNVGDIVLYDTAFEYDLVFNNAFEQIILEIPRQLANEFLRVPEKLNAIKLQGSKPSCTIIQQMIQSVYQLIPEMDDIQQELFFKTILELVDSQYQLKHIPNIDQSCAKYLKVNLIKHYIAKNLKNPKLNTNQIAFDHQMSSRYLNMIFNDEGGNVATWIKQQRLQKIAEDLKNPLLSGRSITEIVFGWGMNDLSNFTRAFKAQFGITAREYRVISNRAISDNS